MLSSKSGHAHQSSMMHAPADNSKVWDEFNAALHPYLLKHNFVTQTPEIVQVLAVTAEQPWVKTICETGFGAGHSALLFLLANSKADVFSFGLGNHDYTTTAEQFLHQKFGDRFKLFKGNSTETLPSFRRTYPGIRCDLVLVDGGYDEPSVKADVQNFRHMVNPANQIMFMMDTPCTASWCVGRGAAFKKAVEAKEVVPYASLPVNKLHGLSSAWFTPVPAPSVPASNFATIVSPGFLANAPSDR